MSYLTRWEIEDLRPDLDRMVAKVIGNTDSSIRNIVENCLYSGFDRKRTTEKLSDVLDSKKASRMYDKLEDILHDYRANAKTRKRPHEDDARKEKEYKKPKPTKQEREFSRDREQDATAKAAVAAAAAAATHSSSTGGGGLLPLPSPPSSSFSSQAAAAAASASPPQVTTETNLTSTQITQMMMNAQREIEERKRALSAIKIKDLPPAAASLSAATNAAAAAAAAIAAAIAAPRPQLPPQTSSLPAHLAAQKLRPSASIEEIERAKKIADLQAQIRAKLSGIGSQTGTIGGTILPPQVQEKPKPLILDEEGRTVDTTGRTISLPTLAPTLKANIRAKKKEIFNKASQPAERSYEEEGQKFVDERIVAKSAMRTKRSLRFHEPGKFQQMAERMRMKSQLEKLQNEISQIARKTGISSATKLALIAPKQDSHADDVPQMEWWDSVILTNDLNTMDGEKVAIRESAITNLIEHPTQMKPPSKCASILGSLFSVFIKCTYYAFEISILNQNPHKKHKITYFA